MMYKLFIWLFATILFALIFSIIVFVTNVKETQAEYKYIRDESISIEFNSDAVELKPIIISVERARKIEYKPEIHIIKNDPINQSETRARASLHRSTHIIETDPNIKVTK